MHPHETGTRPLPPTEPAIIDHLRDTSRPLTPGDRRLVADLLASFVRQLGQLERLLMQASAAGHDATVIRPDRS